MPRVSDADTIRILVATDSHVGYEERDPIRKDDAWRTFDEVLNLARTKDVDMVLLGGDLFHDNKPSRKSMYQVMRSLRKNCLGDKPVELEFLSDANEVFEGAFSHVNYEDADINVSIPVFSIHGNHDDPSGDGHFCSLDLLQVAGLVNYFGRVPEADNISVKPILLRKGSTNLALFGLSNVRDERLFRTFRDRKVSWFSPDSSEWFNLLTVHQNHHAHTATSYLPENVLPDWMDLVIWGHEHECIIDPKKNPETGFHVMQPGSSVATSLVPGEAVQKHVAILNITAKEFTVDKVPLKTVRPFVTREIVLASDKRFKGLDMKKDNRNELTKRLMEVVDEMIAEAKSEWLSLREEEAEDAQDDEQDDEDAPLPLIRLKVEYSPSSEGGTFDCENPQRFSNRFVGRVANTNDVVYFYRKKSSQSRQHKPTAILPEDGLDDMEAESVKVDRLVQEYLAAQSLKILPQAPFGDAVNQFVTKDDKHAMESFVDDSLARQVKQMLELDSDDEDLDNAMEAYKARIEQQFQAGGYQAPKKRVLKPKPDDWDSDFNGHWDQQPGSWTEQLTTNVNIRARSQQNGAGNDDDNDDDVMIDDDDDEVLAPARKTAAKGRAATSKAAKAPAVKKAPAKKAPVRRGRKAAPVEEESDDDIIMDDDDGPPAPALKRSQPTRATRGGARQTTLSFTQSQRQTQQKAFEISDDEISDDDAFEPATAKGRRK